MEAKVDKLDINKLVNVSTSLNKLKKVDDLDVGKLNNTTFLNRKISEVENKIPNDDKNITTPEFNKLTAENFKARLKQTNLVTKTDFDKKLTSFNRKITLNKTKHLEGLKRLNSL